MAKATTVRFSDEVYARLDQASSRSGLPVNSIVVAACLEWMERHMPGPAARLNVPVQAPRWSTIRRAVEVAVAKRPAAGMYPFDAFSQHAQRLLTRSQAEAEKSGVTYIGTEHLLLAMPGEPKSQAGRALATLGLTDDAIRQAINKVLDRPAPKKNKVIVPTSRVKKVIELAFAVCQRAADPKVTTGHILLALATEAEGIAAHVMKDLGADLDSIERALDATEPES